MGSFISLVIMAVLVSTIAVIMFYFGYQCGFDDGRCHGLLDGMKSLERCIDAFDTRVLKNKSAKI